jgi:transposase
VLLRELRERSYRGSYTILTDWLRPQRGSARVVAVRRFETPPGKQGQVDWGHLGSIELEGREHNLWGFTLTLGYSRMMMAEAALDQKLGTLLRMHEEAFRQLDGVPEEILYDRMKTVWLETDSRGEIVWHPVFLDFARYWGFTPRLGRPYRAQTKGKVESGVKYVRRNFLCGLPGREPGCLNDLNAQLRAWVWKWRSNACMERPANKSLHAGMQTSSTCSPSPGDNRIPTSMMSCGK